MVEIAWMFAGKFIVLVELKRDKPDHKMHYQIWGIYNHPINLYLNFFMCPLNLCEGFKKSDVIHVTYRTEII